MMGGWHTLDAMRRWFRRHPGPEVPPMSALDDAVARLKADVPTLIQAAQASTPAPSPDDAAVTELTTLADQIDAALAALAGPGTVPAAPVDGGAVDPASPPVAPVQP